MIKHTYLAPFVLASAALIAFSGCSSDDTEPGPAAGAPGAAGAPAGAGGASGGSGGAPAGGSAGQAGASPAGDPVQGKAVYDMKCSVCHGTNGAGSLGPNISGSMTAGIGSWGEATFTKSVRQAVGKSGQALCSLMTPFGTGDISDAQMKNLYTYLMSVPNDTLNTGSQCP